MGYREQFFEECKSIVGDLSGLSVLIPGCGMGKDCLPFAAAGAHVTGVDVRGDADTIAHPNVRYLRGSIEGCELPSNGFDVVFSIATMEHVGDIEAGFSEMVRLTRPSGVIYSVAAPLWNSRHGHHLSCLRPFPWIHLRSGREQVLEAMQQRNITPKDIEPGILVYLARQHRYAAENVQLEDVLEFVFISDFFNRAPAERYRSACRNLSVSEVLRNDLWMDGEEDLTASIISELAAKNYTRDELLATSHVLIARK